MTQKKNIRAVPEDELVEFVLDTGEKPFRVKQINTWLWQHAVRSFDEMTNLSLNLREALKERYEIRAISINTFDQSSDQTIKYSFKLHDDNIIEGVLIPTKTRITACISSQVGCNLACTFCATGMIRYIRNLEFDEIFDQVAILNEESKKYFEKPLSNIVYMGMGEPLMNYHNVLKSAEYISHPDRLGMSPQRLTVSSVGIAAMIKQLGKDKVRFNFALSLHAPTDEQRGKIIPYNQRNSISDLTEAMKFFHEQTNTRPTIEYVMLKDFNDSIEDAQNLAKFCRSFPVKVNLIQYNPVENSPFEDSGMERIEAFKDFLESKNMIVNVRRSRGKDIDAACGQLANKIVNQ